MMKALILYYSYSGNTRRIAQMIKDKLNCDWAEIETLKEYSKNYNDVVEEGKREIDRGFMPEIKDINTDIKDYDTIILGSPVWWYTFAPAMKTFLNKADLKGKKVYPFATNGGWIGHTLKDFAKECKGAEIHDGLNVKFSGKKLLTNESDIDRWIENIK